MIVPAAMEIYAGAAMLQNRVPKELEEQTDELVAAGGQLRQYYAIPAVDPRSYMLGLETARALLATNPVLRQHGIDPSTLL